MSTGWISRRKKKFQTTLDTYVKLKPSASFILYRGNGQRFPLKDRQNATFPLYKKSISVASLAQFTEARTRSGRAELECWSDVFPNLVDSGFDSSCSSKLFINTPEYSRGINIHNRRCLTKEQCLSKKIQSSKPTKSSKPTTPFYKAIDGKEICEHTCPDGYQENGSGECVECKPNKCRRACIGSEINSLSGAAAFKNCQIVSGNLEIMIQTGLGGNVVKKLEEVLGNIQEVHGYVRVSFTPSIVSMSILKGLKLIRGEKLWMGKYALAIFENKNLAQLWNTTEKSNGIEVKKGRVAFYLNPQLCQKVIQQFFDWSRVYIHVYETDVSANGDKAICDEVRINLTIIGTHSDTAILMWDEFDASMIDHRMFLGYQIYYKRVESESVNIFENRDACSDSWKMTFSDNKERGTLIHHLKPDTLYAVYVKTLVVFSQQVNGTMTGAISPVVFFRTKFNHPTSAILTRLESPDPHSLYIEWLPPESPNGQVTHYVVSYAMKLDNVPKERNYCDEPPSYSHKTDRTQPIVSSQLSVSEISDRSCTAPHCCTCSTSTSAGALISESVDELPEDFDSVHERAVFENIIQNTVFLSTGQHRSKRTTGQPSILTNVDNQTLESYASSRPNISSTEGEQENELALSSSAFDTSVADTGRKHLFFDRNAITMDSHHKSFDFISRRSLNLNANFLDRIPIGFTLDSNGSVMRRWKNMSKFAYGAINVTSLNVTLRDLRHFTAYEIRVSACQNTSVEFNYCSRPDVLRTVRTSFSKSADAINTSSVVVLNATRGSNTDNRLIRWEEPESPNGLIVAYEVEYVRQPALSTDQTPVAKKECLLASAYKNTSGVYLLELLPGNYSVSVRTVSLAQRGPWTPKIYFFIAERRSTSLTTVLWTSVGLALVFVLVGVALGVYVYRRYFKRHMDEYVMKVVSANPDYLSSLEVYRKDEWELKRECIQLGKQIGRGCFGTVYKGYGIDNSVESVCGVRFGDCAIKTAFEKASFIDRFQFLLEASVMKDLNTAYIVKLLGVVSESHPAWVVMEYMENGSLKEYLMDRMPDDSNTKGLPPPTCQQMHLMAAQIADGMAYLEARKFLHRDLAARNCMVTADGTCKIGDFGFARDVYCKEYYKLKEKRLMPARWMPPEALKDGTFSSPSDVWSYGVLLWEIASYGSQPYPGLSNQEVLDYVVDKRLTLAPSRNCPSFLADIMKSTWMYEPHNRPTFDTLVSLLAPFGGALFKQISYHHAQRRTDLKPVHKNLKDVVMTSVPSDSSGNGVTTGSCPSDQSADRVLLVQPPNDNFERAEKKSQFEDPICNNNRRVDFWAWMLNVLPFHKARLSSKEKRPRRALNGCATVLNGRKKC